jgi:hypothetical protein
VLEQLQRGPAPAESGRIGQQVGIAELKNSQALGRPGGNGCSKVEEPI